MTFEEIADRVFLLRKITGTSGKKLGGLDSEDKVMRSAKTLAAYWLEKAGSEHGDPQAISYQAALELLAGIE